MKDEIRNLPGYAGLERLWAALPEARLVGGCVRDLIIGRRIHDIDLAVPCDPDETIKRLSTSGIKVIPTGLDHGTVTALIERVPFEVTTLRRDVETDGRHAVVAWTHDWREDAERRDFTINAMSLDQHGQLYDYFSGKEDLKQGRVRFVGEARKRIEEDALRALRFFRFQARYGQGEPDQQAIKAVYECRGLMRSLSIERVVSEFFRILEGPHLWSIVLLMAQAGILGEILPQADLSSLERLLKCQDPPYALTRLFALAPHDISIGRHFKLSRVQQESLKAYAQPEPVLCPEASDNDLRCLRFKQNISILIDRSWLVQAREVGKESDLWSHFRARLLSLPQPVFPLTGRDGLACGLQGGPELGQWLKKTQAWWLEQGCLPEKEACQSWLKEQVSLTRLGC